MEYLPISRRCQSGIDFDVKKGADEPVSGFPQAAVCILPPKGAGGEGRDSR